MAGIMETHRNNVKVPIFAVQTATAPRRGVFSSLFGPAPMTDTPLARLTALGLSLPTMPSPVANYVPFVIEGNLLFLSGQGPRRAEGGYFTGKVGRDVTVEEAYEHARATGLQLISVMNTALGDLSRVRRIVKVLGMVNGMPDFADQPKVINGCSDLFVAVFGDKGRHARSAVGMGSLPNGISVEIEAIVAID
jgi:enamine deaminase RidA (YjgF/YER057c/UK114 family)